MNSNAFLLDLDGVITDTARYHYAAWKSLTDELCLHFTQADNEKLKGISRLASLDVILALNDCQNKYTQ
ncbi:MAG: beta-phosphoglucomutase, partial [Ruthenibacterium sp.]